ncbi:calcium/sodium antiporter [Novosphingobium aquimarinum]|uniref:calcium/sodium antiporter n=1 Tax=Novosphingobium aquimarinum TaxID=2682494 RepID=UPI0012EC286C|nr:calcium/sodium antiporter [Novosphingobium aquimarinum]
MIAALLAVAGGLIALVIGGELLVRGAVRLAEKLGVSALVIGLVIIGFGTSLPELVTSAEAALAGSPAIAWGNIVGSNNLNSLLILGAAALAAPITITAPNRYRDPAVALAAAGALTLLAVFQIGGWWTGAALLACLIAYIAWCYREERLVAPDTIHNAPNDRGRALELADTALHDAQGSWAKPVVLLIGGFALLVWGGGLLVGGAIDLALLAGLGEAFIGLTIVALGTSLPELVTSVIAARKGEPELAFGNVVGSNIYNILGIGGATLLLAPAPIPQDLLPLDIGVVLASGLVILALALRRRISRMAALGLLAAYAVYLGIVIANA